MVGRNFCESWLGTASFRALKARWQANSHKEMRTPANRRRFYGSLLSHLRL